MQLQWTMGRRPSQGCCTTFTYSTKMTMFRFKLSTPVKCWIVPPFSFQFQCLVATVKLSWPGIDCNVTIFITFILYCFLINQYQYSFFDVNESLIINHISSFMHYNDKLLDGIGVIGFMLNAILAVILFILASGWSKIHSKTNKFLCLSLGGQGVIILTNVGMFCQDAFP